MSPQCSCVEGWVCSSWHCQEVENPLEDGKLEERKLSHWGHTGINTPSSLSFHDHYETRKPGLAE
jgi:hypothetical protein